MLCVRVVLLSLTHFTMNADNMSCEFFAMFDIGIGIGTSTGAINIVVFYKINNCSKNIIFSL